MFPINLNNKYRYTLVNKTYTPSPNESTLINDPLIDITFWKKKGTGYVSYKKTIKEHHYFGQQQRCAYCRSKLRTDAYWEDLDHVVAQTTREKWIFYPKNLIVTCGPCNRIKNADVTLTDPTLVNFPTNSSEFTIFNPHFDRWEDHFEIFNGIFLRGRAGTKGPATYSHCHLYRYDIIINNVDERRSGIWTMKRLTHMLSKIEKDTNEYDHIKKAITHLIRKKQYKP